MVFSFKNDRARPETGQMERRPARWPDQPPWGAGDLPDDQWRRLRLPHPRHAGMVLDRAQRLVRLHPHDQYPSYRGVQ